MHSLTPVSTQTTWVLTFCPGCFSNGPHMINWPAPQTQSRRCPVLQTGSPTSCNGGAYFVGLKEDDGWSANRLSAHHHYDLPSVHFPAKHPNSPLASPPDHDVMAHDIISSGTANLPLPFFATRWTFINSDRITSGKGCTGTGLGHTQWVGKCKQGGFWWREKKKFSFNLD